MTSLVQDLRFGFRQLVASRGFTLVAVLALALGIGANTVIFSLVHELLLRPLPFAEPDRLVFLFSNQQQAGLVNAPVSEPDYVDWHKDARSFQGMGALDDASLNLTGDGEPERLNAARVTASTFETLGTIPVVGRVFRTEEEEPGRDQVVLLSYGLWQRRFASDRAISGRRILLDGKPYTVVGVMPPRFTFPENKQAWVPFRPIGNDPDRQGRHHLTVAARLKPGVTLAQAQAEMDTFAKRLEKAREEDAGWTTAVALMHEEYVKDVRPMLAALLGAVAFVLLIACANVANLLLARSNKRRREVAIRAALGAGRLRLVRQFLVESLLLSLAGGLAALLPAMWGIDVFARMAGQFGIASNASIRLDGTVLAFNLAVSLATGLLFGLAPALRASRSDLGETLKQGGKGSPGGGGRLRSLLVLGEVTLSLVLLVGAGLMIRTFLNVRNLRTGFNADHVMTVHLALPGGKYASDAQQANFFGALVQRLRTSPGIQAAAVTSSLPLSGNDRGNGLFFNDRPDPERSRIPIAYRREITPEYFRAMEIPVVRGRAFTAADTETSQKVVILNERTVRQFWPHEDPIGKQVRRGGDRTKNPPLTVVGVVGDVRHQALTAEMKYEMYLPLRQSAASDAYLVVRTAGEAEGAVPAIRAALGELDPEIPMFNVRSMRSYVSEATAEERVAMVLFGLFGAIALLLAAVGIYGVMAYSVAQRTAEIGIRMALGADRSAVLRLVLGEALGVVALGLALGIPLSWGLTQLLSQLLYGVKPTDPLVYAAVVVVLGFVALAANYIPARRATQVDPMIALRYE